MLHKMPKDNYHVFDVTQYFNLSEVLAYHTPQEQDMVNTCPKFIINGSAFIRVVDYQRVCTRIVK